MPSLSQSPQSTFEPTFELQELSNMDRIKRLFRSSPEYEPIHSGAERDEESVHDESEDDEISAPFSWIEYAIFLLLGIAMLWAW